MSNTLVLNADGNVLSIIPLSVISWQLAVKLVMIEKANIIEAYDNLIHSQSLVIPKPSVIMLRNFHKNNYKPTFSKMNMLYRDDFTCQYCNKKFFTKDLTLDHVYPKSKGGKKVFENMVVCCHKCNTKKADKYMKPLSIPRQPTYFELVSKRKKYPMIIAHPSWKKYLNWDDNLIKFGNVPDKFQIPIGEYT